MNMRCNLINESAPPPVPGFYLTGQEETLHGFQQIPCPFPPGPLWALLMAHGTAQSLLRARRCPPRRSSPTASATTQNCSPPPPLLLRPLPPLSQAL